MTIRKQNLTVQEQLQLIAGLAQIMKDFKLDAVDTGDVKMVKRHHDSVDVKESIDTDDDDFYSSEG